MPGFQHPPLDGRQLPGDKSVHKVSVGHANHRIGCVTQFWIVNPRVAQIKILLEHGDRRVFQREAKPFVTVGQRLLNQSALGYIRDVELDDAVTIFGISVGHHLDLAKGAILGLQRQVFIPDLSRSLQGFKHVLVGLRVAEQPDLENFHADQIAKRISKQFGHERIGVDDLSRVGVDDHNAIMRCFEQATIADFRNPDLICITGRMSTPRGITITPAKGTQQRFSLLQARTQPLVFLMGVYRLLRHDCPLSINTCGSSRRSRAANTT